MFVKKEKKISLVVCLFVFIAFSISSCASDDSISETDNHATEEQNNNSNTDNNDHSEDDTFQITVDETSYTSNAVQGILEDGLILFSTRINNSQDLVQISLSGNIAAGTYDLANNDVNITFIIAGGISNTFISTSGTIVISEHNTDAKTFSATFNATVKDALTGKESIELTHAELSNVSYTAL